MGNCGQPLISVLIPTYNCAQFIREAIDSVLAQEYDKLEIIVVDDGSTDNTKEVLKNYSSSLKYFYQENKGVAVAHNACVRYASGDLIAWLDADDYWLPGKLRAQVDYMNKHPECQILFTKYDHFYENEAVAEELKNNPNVQHQIDFALVNKNYLPSSLAKKAVFEECGEFDENIRTGEDDTDMIHRLLVFGIGMNHYLDAVYYMRRLHRNNITWSHNDSSPKQFFNKFILPNMRRNIQRRYL